MRLQVLEFAIHTLIETRMDMSVFDGNYKVENIFSKAENLDELPEIGRVVPEIGDENVRELIIYSYRPIYEVAPNDVQNLAIIHGKRDFSSLDRNDLKR